MFRQVLTKSQISSLSLMIEMERYQTPKIPRELRLCKLCQHSKIENKEHSLFQYKTYATTWSIFFANCNNKIKCFTKSSDSQTLVDSSDEFIHVEIAIEIHL